MDFKTKLSFSVNHNNSLVCVGLDSDTNKLPSHIKDLPNAQFEFNKAIIDATADLVCAYKPNSAFYEAQGAESLVQLQKTCAYINETYPNIPIILDAKRADIGNTNKGYVSFAFDYLGADAITVHPYLGGEALTPFLDRKDKGIIVLCRTSNPGAGELQDLEIDDGPLYLRAAALVRDKWNTNNNCLLVVGATYPEEMTRIRKLVGDDIAFLVPGIGAQGGDLEGTLKAGLTKNSDGLLISSSRGVIFASSGEDFAEAARAETQKLRDAINAYR